MALKINGNAESSECQLNLQRSVLRDPQHNEIQKTIQDKTDMHDIQTLSCVALVTSSLNA